MSTTATGIGAPQRRGATARLASLAGPVVIAIAVQSLANLVFHAVLGRSLSPADYGALGTVLAAMTLVAVPLTALQTAAARTTATTGITSRISLLGPLIGLAVIGWGLFHLAVPMADFLYLPSRWDAALLAPTFVVAGLLASARGQLLGVGRTRLVAGSYLLSTALRLGLGVALAVPLGVTGALLATVAGEAAALLIAVRGLGKAPRAATAIRDLAMTTATVTGLFVFTTIDLFLARHYLPGAASGAYVAAATIGKTLLALPAAAMSVAYPRLVASVTNGAGTGSALRSALVVVGGPALAGAVAVSILPGLVLTVLYGDAFGGSGSLVAVLALIAGTSALVSVLAHAGLARGARTALLPWAGVLVQIAAIIRWHDSAMAVAAASAVSLVVVLAVLAIFEVPRWTGRTAPA